MKINSRLVESHFELRRHPGAPSVIRTRDLLLRRQSLYPLSYRGPRETLAYLRRAHGSRTGGAGE